MAYHLFVLNCARVGGLGVIDSDSVDDEGVDIACRLGSNHLLGLVVCKFDGRKRTIDEGRDCEVLAWVDFKGRHGLAPGQDREKVGEEHVEVDKFHRWGSTSRVSSTIRISPASTLHQHMHRGA